jgi:hypothetical protein
MSGINVHDNKNFNNVCNLSLKRMSKMKLRLNFIFRRLSRVH